MRKKFIGNFSIGEINYCLNKKNATQIKLHLNLSEYKSMEHRLRKYSDMLELNPLLLLELGLEVSGKIHYLRVQEINWEGNREKYSHLCELVVTCRTKLEKKKILSDFRKYKKIGYR